MRCRVVVPGPVDCPNDADGVVVFKDGDRIVMAATNSRIDLLVDEEELTRRRAEWVIPEPRYKSGFLAKYARLAQGAELGAITNI